MRERSAQIGHDTGGHQEERRPSDIRAAGDEDLTPLEECGLGGVVEDARAPGHDAGARAETTKRSPDQRLGGRSDGRREADEGIGRIRQGAVPFELATALSDPSGDACASAQHVAELALGQEERGVGPRVRLASGDAP